MEATVKMMEDIIQRLRKAENLIIDCETLARNDKHYLNRMRDINCEIEKLLYDLETHYA